MSWRDQPDRCSAETLAGVSRAQNLCLGVGAQGLLSTPARRVAALLKSHTIASTPLGYRHALRGLRVAEDRSVEACTPEASICIAMLGVTPGGTAPMPGGNKMLRLRKRSIIPHQHVHRNAASCLIPKL